MPLTVFKKEKLLESKKLKDGFCLLVGDRHQLLLESDRLILSQLTFDFQSLTGGRYF